MNMCVHYPSSAKNANMFIKDFVSFVAVLIIYQYQDLSRHLLKANVKHELIKSNDGYFDVNDKFRIHILVRCVLSQLRASTVSIRNMNF